MTVRITQHFDDAEVRGYLGVVATRMRDTTPLMRAIGAGMVENARTRIENEVSPNGKPFAPLHPRYAAGKRGPGTLRESGVMLASLTFDAHRNVVETGSNRVQAGVHQHGAVIVPKHAPKLMFRMGGQAVFADRVAIPARPFLGWGREDQTMTVDAIKVYLA